VSHDEYGLFVWPAYAITAVVFAWMVIDTVLRAGRWRRKAELWEFAERRDRDKAP
jgi:heme exporter protein D